MSTLDLVGKFSGGGSDGDFGRSVSYLKLLKGDNRLRLYRFGEPQVFYEEGEARVWPFGDKRGPAEEGDPLWDEYAQERQSLYEEADKLDEAGDEGSIEVAKKRRRVAGSMKPKVPVNFVMVKTSEPSGHRIYQTTVADTHKILVALAQAAGWEGKLFPSLDAPDETKSAFNEAATAGVDLCCGPTGRDLVCDYDKDRDEASNYKLWSVDPSQGEELDLPEDESVPIPSEVRQRIRDAMARKAAEA